METIIKYSMLVSLVRSYIRKDYGDVPSKYNCNCKCFDIFFHQLIYCLTVFQYWDMWAMQQCLHLCEMVADDIEEYRKWQRQMEKNIQRLILGEVANILLQISKAPYVKIS